MLSRSIVLFFILVVLEVVVVAPFGSIRLSLFVLARTIITVFVAMEYDFDFVV